jgi:hypothetical protein
MQSLEESFIEESLTRPDSMGRVAFTPDLASRIPRPSELPFQLEIAPEAWTQISTISGETFDLIRERIHALATQQQRLGPSRAQGPQETRLECDGHVITFSVNLMFHMITLQRIYRKRAS